MKKSMVKRLVETRALPTLVEKRNNLVDEMEGLINKAKEETRALSEDENKRYDEIESEIRSIDETLTKEEQSRSFTKTETKAPTGEEEVRALEEKNFLKFVRGDERALDVANNGGVIPQTIANKIIERVKELSPIYNMVTVYNVSGDLVFPVYDETTPIQANYVDDLTELTEQTGKFTTVKLTNFIVGSLAKISKSLMNRSDFDLLTFVINKVAKAIADFLEAELIKGTAGKMTGLAGATQSVTTAAVGVVGVDDLIDAQMTVPECYQANAGWIMHKNTLKSLRKLKDAEGNYLLNRDVAAAFGWTLLGKQVYITESCDAAATGKTAVFYGDFSGLYLKLTKNVELQMLMEKYATQHAVGAVGYVECDSKIVEPQKIVKVVVK